MHIEQQPDLLQAGSPVQPVDRPTALVHFEAPTTSHTIPDDPSNLSSLIAELGADLPSAAASRAHELAVSTGHWLDHAQAASIASISTNPADAIRFVGMATGRPRAPSSYGLGVEPTAEMLRGLELDDEATEVALPPAAMGTHWLTAADGSSSEVSTPRNATESALATASPWWLDDGGAAGVQSISA